MQRLRVNSAARRVQLAFRRRQARRLLVLQTLYAGAVHAFSVRKEYTISARSTCAQDENQFIYFSPMMYSHFSFSILPTLPLQLRHHDPVQVACICAAQALHRSPQRWSVEEIWEMKRSGLLHKALQSTLVSRYEEIVTFHN